MGAFGSVDAQYRSARVTPGFDLVYVPMTVPQRTASLAGIHDAKNLQDSFRTKVAHLVQAVHKKSEIVWSMVRKTGGWRSFDGQAGLASDAGNGESIHHYGYAVDMTIVQFTWFAGDLRLRNAPISLQGLEKPNEDQLFAERDKAATTLNLFKTTKDRDLYHLQNYDDDTLDSVSSLMALMHAVGPKKMNWKPQYRKPVEVVGLWYDDFSPTTDEEIRELLAAARRPPTSRAPRAAESLA